MTGRPTALLNTTEARWLMRRLTEMEERGEDIDALAAEHPTPRDLYNALRKHTPA